jgi:hypothetical protein
MREAALVSELTEASLPVLAEFGLVSVLSYFRSHKNLCLFPFYTAKN